MLNSVLVFTRKRREVEAERLLWASVMQSYMNRQATLHSRNGPQGVENKPFHNGSTRSSAC